MTLIKSIFLYSALTFFGVALIYFIIMRRCEGFIPLITIPLSGAIMLLLAGFMQRYYNEYYTDVDWSSWTPALTLQIGIYCIYGFVLLYFVCVLCMYKNLQRAILVMKTASAVISANIKMIFVPLVAAAAVCAYLVGWLLMFITLVSCAEITINPGKQMKGVSFTGHNEVLWMLLV